MEKEKERVKRDQDREWSGFFCVKRLLLYSGNPHEFSLLSINPPG